MRPSASQRPSAPAGISPMQGELQSSTIPNLFHELGAAQATGVLTVAGRTIRKAVSLQAGKVQFASSTDRDDRFNQVLVKAGVISLRDLLRALEVSLATHDRLGEVLVRHKALKRAEVEKWLRLQVREIIYSLFNRTTGRWSFETKPVAAESIRLGVTGDVVVVEGIRRVTSWQRLSEEVGGVNAEFLATNRAAEMAASLPLNTWEKKLLEMCRTPTTLGEMCDARLAGDFDVCKAIWALVTVGALMKS